MMPPFVRKILIYAGIAGGLFGAGWIIAKTRKRTHHRPPVKLTGKGVSIEFRPDPYVDKLYNAMAGLSFSPIEKEQTWAQVYDLRDDELIIIYDRFNQLHGDKGSILGDYGTLTQWIRDEQSAVGSIKPQLLARLEGLQLI